MKKASSPQELFLQNPDLIRQVEGFTQEWLVVAQQSTNSRVRLVKVRITTSVTGRKEEVIVEEPSLIVNKVEDRLVAGHDNGVIAVVETTEDGQVTLRYGVGSDVEKIVPLTKAAHCLHVIGKAVYLGFSNSVGWVDFSREEPNYVQLVEKHHPYGSEKSYDMFARNGDLLVAVDDIMLLYYGDSFRLGAIGPVHDKSFELPSLINGSYKLAAMVNQEHLLLTSTFYHRGGCGSILHRLSIAEQGQQIFSAKHEFVECQAHSGAIRQALTDEVPSTSALSSWMDLAVHGGTDVLIAAGERGLLSLPVQFDNYTKAVVLLRGKCTAVRVLSNDSIWALTTRDEFHGLVKVDRSTGALLKQVRMDDTYGMLL